MATPPDATVVVATRTEERAMRREAPLLRVRRCGVALRDWHDGAGAALVVSAGLAGGLRADLAPGTVVVASAVSWDGEPSVACDAAWRDALLHAAQRLRVPVVVGDIVTRDAMITGPEREAWARRGFVATDMESGLLSRRAERIAALRVVLDTRSHELSPRWLDPGRALLDPRRWGEALWLARLAPRCARRAALVVGAAAAAL